MKFTDDVYAEIHTAVDIAMARYGIGTNWSTNSVNGTKHTTIITFYRNYDRKVISIIWEHVINVYDTSRAIIDHVLEYFGITSTIQRNSNVMQIKNVIFNNPATIVFWEDGTKTVVKCQDGDVYDPEKGLAMAITKKALGNKGNYCNELKKWLEKYEPSDDPSVINLQIITDKDKDAMDAWIDALLRLNGGPKLGGDYN